MLPVHHRPIGPAFGAILLLGCGDGQAPATGEDGTGSASGTSAGADTTTGTDPSADSSSDVAPCVPSSCADEGLDCGLVPDGCGEQLDCGECDAPQTCGGGGIDNVCGIPCEPTSCASEALDCGLVPDGCGGELDCGTCEDPQVCGGTGLDNVCGVACTPVAAIFFDLGETLVEPAGGGLFAERPGAAALLADLKALPMPIGLITNTPLGWTEDDLRAVLINPDLLDEFDVVLLSSQAPSPPKPDPGIFLDAYMLLRSPPPIEQVAFVTEELGHIANARMGPTQGAKAAGMLGVHLSDGAPSPLTDYTFAPDDLDAIAQIAQVEWLPCATKARAKAATKTDPSG